MRAFVLALLMSSSLAACTMPGAPDDATRLETGAGERARADAPAAPGAAASPDASDDAASPAAAPTTPAPPLEAPPMSEPLPPEPAAEAAPGGAASSLAPDRSCRTSADCVVKNVGNCCGAMPACVNAGARTDPAAVQAQCARQGMAGVCGFKEVTSCSCVAGTCRDGEGAVAQ